MTRILVVDDKEMMRDSVATLLGRRGHAVVAAPGGKQAIAKLEAKRPDAVVTDLQMPDMNGLQLLEEIHALDDSIPVVFMTAYGTVETAVEAMRDEGYVDNAARMEEVMRTHMRELAAKHPSVGSYRATGLFGALELQKNAAGDPLSGYNETHPAVAKLIRTLLEKGLFTLSHWNMIFCNPPLCITEEQLGESFKLLDDCLAITDEVYEG